jgi:folate-binding protein YgfZ
MDLLRPDLLVRQSAGILDLSARGRVVVRGADRRSFLQALLTNDVAALEPGTGCHALLLTPQGRCIADLRVLELGDLLLIDVDRPVKDVLLQKFDALVFSEDVQLGDVTDAWGALGLYGPAAAAIAAGLAGDPSASAGTDLGPYENRRITWRGEAAVLARIDRFGLPGYVVFAPMAAMQALGDACLAAGAHAMDGGLAELLRIEGGEPAFLVDVTDETIPLEAGLETTAVSFTKGCFPGQEVLVRIRDRGHGRVARKLVGLTVEGDVTPEHGAILRASDKDVGVLTSAVRSEAVGRTIGLGYVHRDHLEPGTALTVVTGAGAVGATVTTLPFVR